MAIANAAEKRIGEKNTWAFIVANPELVQLRRPRTQPTASGGVRRLDPEILPEQSFRIVPMSGVVWDRSRTTPDEGRIEDVTEMLIGMPDADVKKWDYFPTALGDRPGFYQITHVSPVKGYRRESRLRWVATEPKAAG